MHNSTDIYTDPYKSLKGAKLSKDAFAHIVSRVISSKRGYKAIQVLKFCLTSQMSALNLGAQLSSALIR